MSSSINCPNGHANPTAQLFCGQCGVSLAGVCINGHQNTEGQKYCGQCGIPLGQSHPVRSASSAFSPGSTAEMAGGGTTPPDPYSPDQRGQLGQTWGAPPPGSQPPPQLNQLNQTMASNLLSVIAFACAALALLGGLVVGVPLTTIFGVAAIICGVVALGKKEHLARFAILAAVGGLLVGWILQAALFNAAFH